jgi:hypothetical protein
MTDWLEQVDELLYEGETVAVGTGGVVVTSYRVLAFTPDREGANFRDVDRPNVVGVAGETAGDRGFLQQAVKAIAVGLVLVVVGQTVSLDSLVAGVSIGSGAGQVGMGGMLGLLQSFLTLVAQLDELVTLFGGLALLFGTVVLGVYARSRTHELIVSVAGEDDIRLAAPDDADEVARRLEAAIVPGDSPD